MFDFDFKEMLQNGSKGEPVQKLQQALKTAGFDPGDADGIFGAKTKAALTKMQQSAGVDADGVFGPQSKEAFKQMLVDKAQGKAGELLEKRFGGAIGGMFKKD